MQVVSLCEAGALKPMCDLLDASDERTVCVILDGLSNILSAAQKQGEVEKVATVIEECEGLDKIENLQTHQNEEVYQKALDIIETYFTEGVSTIFNSSISSLNG
jgi:importin subunit alpha-2